MNARNSRPIFAVVVVGLSLPLCSSCRREPAYKHKREGLLTIADRVERARDRNEAEVRLKPWIVDYVNFRDLDQVFDDYQLVCAKLIGKMTVPNRMVVEDLITFLRFTVIENITGQPFGIKPAPDFVPREFRQAGENEIISWIDGGTITLEGVSVRSAETLADLVPGRTYVFFVHGKESRWGGIPYDVHGIFVLGDNGRLTPLRQHNAFVAYFAGRDVDTLDKLRQLAKAPAPR